MEERDRLADRRGSRSARSAAARGRDRPKRQDDASREQTTQRNLLSQIERDVVSVGDLQAELAFDLVDLGVEQILEEIRAIDVDQTPEPVSASVDLGDDRIIEESIVIDVDQTLESTSILHVDRAEQTGVPVEDTPAREADPVVAPTPDLGADNTPEVEAESEGDPAPEPTGDVFYGSGFPGGSRILDLLLSYEYHVVTDIWTRTLPVIADPRLKTVDTPKELLRRRILRCYTRPPHHFLDLHRHGDDVEGGWWDLAGYTGLHRLSELDYGGVDHVLISAFVERWHPETNAFHFSWREISITLHDVEHILSIPIDGVGVAGLWTMEELDQLAADLFGIEPVIALVARKAGGFHFEDIRGREVLAEEPGAPEVHVLGYFEEMITVGADNKRLAAVYLYVLFGTTLFPDKTTNRVSVTP